MIAEIRARAAAPLADPPPPVRAGVDAMVIDQLRADVDALLAEIDRLTAELAYQRALRTEDGAYDR